MTVKRSAREMFRDAERPARKIYEVTCRLALETYRAAERSAWKKSAREMFEDSERPGQETYEVACRLALETYRAAERLAWQKYVAAVHPRMVKGAENDG